MKIKLGVLERLLLNGMLPKEGNMLTLRIVKDLDSKLSFGAKEQKETFSFWAIG